MATLMLGEQVSPVVRWSVLHDAKGNGVRGWGWLSLLVCGRIMYIDERTATLTGREYFVYNPVAPRRRTSLHAHEAQAKQSIT